MEDKVNRYLVFLFGVIVGMVLAMIMGMAIPGNKAYEWGWKEAEKKYLETGELKYHWQPDSAFVKNPHTE